LPAIVGRHDKHPLLANQFLLWKAGSIHTVQVNQLAAGTLDLDVFDNIPVALELDNGLMLRCQIRLGRSSLGGSDDRLEIHRRSRRKFPPRTGGQGREWNKCRCHELGLFELFTFSNRLTLRLR
jgi:hypothetical protein